MGQQLQYCLLLHIHELHDQQVSLIKKNKF